MRWWDVDTWKLLHIRQAHDHAVYSVQLSPDGDLVASCGDDSTVKIWGMESTELVRTLRRDRPYERLNITGAKGLTAEQKATLYALGAYDETEQPYKIKEKIPGSRLAAFSTTGGVVPKVWKSPEGSPSYTRGHIAKAFRKILVVR